MPAKDFNRKRSFTFTLFTERIDRFLRGPGGEVDRLTQQAAGLVYLQAKQEIGPKGYSGDHGGRILANSGSVVRGERRGDWKVRFRHRAAEVHYTGAPRHKMPRKTGRTAYNRYSPRSFGPTQGPINHPGHTGNPYIAKAARKLGLTIPSVQKGGLSGNVIRVPRGFA